jgi:hypothetical protein
MSMHLAAYQSSITNDSALHQLTGVTDPILRASGNGFQVNPQLTKVGSLWLTGTSALRAQLQSQSLRAQPFPTFQPVNVGAANESPPRIADLWDSPLVLAAYEELDAFAAQNNATSSETETLFAIFFDSLNPRQSGQYLRARFTATTTLVANAWTAIVPAFDQALQVGTYAICGGWVFSTGGLAFRIVPASGPPYRPGGLMVQAPDGMIPEFQKPGRLGQWMTFDSLTPPELECFSVSADTAENGELYLLPIQLR